MKVDSGDNKKYFFDHPQNVKRLRGIFYASLVVFLLLDLVVSHHPHFRFEHWPEFYAVYGFVAYVSLVVISKFVVRALLRREEDYYDR